MPASRISRRHLLTIASAAALAPQFGRATSASAVCAPPPTPGAKANPTVAISLRELSKTLSGRRTARFEGMTRLDGFAIDVANKDIALFGLTESGKSDLHAEDFVVALRSAYTRGEEYRKSPAISLDPEDGYFHRIGKIPTWKPEGRLEYERQCKLTHWQTVRVDGMPRHSRAAKVLVDADYRMKQVSQGAVSYPSARRSRPISRPSSLIGGGP